MANADKSNLIRIYGVTLANADARTRPCGHGRTKLDEIIPDVEKGVWVEYVDYFIEDLVALIKNQKLEKEVIKKLSNEK